MENEDTHSSYQRHAFLRHGFHPDNVSCQMRILGIDFATAPGDDGDCSKARVRNAMQIAARLARARVPLKVLYRTRVVLKACWGWWFLGFPTKGLNDLLKLLRSVAYVQRMCSRDLRVMLEGHMFCPTIMVLSASIRQFRVAIANGL